MKATDVHLMLGKDGWKQTLVSLGIPEALLTGRHGPCPACGGRDRFRFDNRRGQGNFICNQCGSGDGFALLSRVHGWSFREAFEQITKGLHVPAYTPPVLIGPARPASPTARIRRMLSESCAIEDCDAAVDYLASRKLWPLPEHHGLRAHAATRYWDGQADIGAFPAILARVTDQANELVTVHVTYLTAKGEKLTTHESRKILSPLTGREGCGVRIGAASDLLGIAEGIETALSATLLEGCTVWSALNAPLLAKFTPPPIVQVLRIYADGDVAGLKASAALMERLQGTVRVELRAPAAGKDWNDVLRGSP